MKGLSTNPGGTGGCKVGENKGNGSKSKPSGMKMDMNQPPKHPMNKKKYATSPSK